MNTADHTQDGECGNHRCINSPAAVNSEAMNRFAYMWKLPAYGMATDSSPNDTITQ